jgi:hypothetical protein
MKVIYNFVNLNENSIFSFQKRINEFLNSYLIPNKTSSFKINEHEEFDENMEINLVDVIPPFIEIKKQSYELNKHIHPDEIMFDIQKIIEENDFHSLEYCLLFSFVDDYSQQKQEMDNALKFAK